MMAVSYTHLDVYKRQGIPYSLYQYKQLGDMAERDYPDFAEKFSEKLPYNINLIHINPYDLGLAFLENHEMWDGRYNIGFWLWESEEFPEEWLPCFHCFDEIWTPSEFISNAIRKKTKLPVVTIPYHIEMPGNKMCIRDRYNTFLIKNPALLILKLNIINVN